VRSRRRERGAILAITLILSIVLFIMATSIFFLFTMNMDSYEYTAGRVRAMAAAEAGASIALYELGLGTGAPSGPEPYSLQGDSAQWVAIPGSEDMAWVVVDPFDSNTIPNVIGGVEIRSRGLSRGVTRDIVIRTAPDYPSRYALLVNDRIPAGILLDGAVFDGPVHGNGTVEFSSQSPDSLEDPYVASVSTSQEEFYFTGYGYSDLPHPDGSAIWVRPYDSHLQGSPYWVPGADSIDFQELDLWFRQLQTAAASQGTMVYAPARVLLYDGMLLSRQMPEGATDTLMLAGKDLVYVQGGVGPVYFKTVGSITEALTIVFSGPVNIAGQIQGPSSETVGPLAVVTLSDFVIAEEPEHQSEQDWPSPWDVQTGSDIHVNAVLAAPSGGLRAEDPGWPNPCGRFTVFGGMILDHLGLTGIGGNGYEVFVAWEQNLTSMHPPHFPALDRWKTLSWRQDPDYEGLNIDDNMQ
jgi:hypothetical protein